MTSRAPVKIDDELQKFYEVFSPIGNELIEFANSTDLFAHYTPAEACMEIIKNKEIWSRNARGMNDIKEIEHGIECFEVFLKKETGLQFLQFCESVLPRAFEKIEELRKNKYNEILYNTYLFSLAQHKSEFDDFGKLSMWRAYGKTALIFDPTSWFTGNYYNRTFSKVKYFSHTEYVEKFAQYFNQLKINEKYIEALIEKNEISISNYFYEMIKSIIVCNKHPGFKEEEEWRLVLWSNDVADENVKRAVVSIKETPETIYKIKIDKGLY